MAVLALSQRPELVRLSTCAYLRQLIICQFHAVVHVRIPLVERHKYGVLNVEVLRAKVQSRFVLLIKWFVIDVR